MAGNTLGPREKFLYTTDSGVQIRLNTDKDLGQAGGLTQATAGQGATKPLGMTPRGVWCQRSVTQAPDGAGTGEGTSRIQRKFIPCGAESALYKSDTPQNVTIDGATFITTGRVGEKQRFI